RAAGHDRGRSARVAQLPVLGLPVALLPGLYINHKPVEGEAQIVHLDAQGLADKRIRAGGADKPARLDYALFAGGDPLAVLKIPGVDFDANAIRDFRDAPSAPPLANFDAQLRFYVLIQDALELRLSEHVRDRPAARAHAPCIELQQHLAVGVAPLVGVGRFGDLSDIRHHA